MFSVVITEGRGVGGGGKGYKGDIGNRKDTIKNKTVYCFSDMAFTFLFIFFKVVHLAWVRHFCVTV